MKKIYLPLTFVLGALSLNAQVKTSNAVSRGLESISYSEKSEKPDNIQKAEGDIIWQNDFSVAADWTISAADVQGQWQITTGVPTVPANFTGYVGTMASTTAANGYAIFNGVQYLVAGNPANQNALITTANPIDLSAHSSVTLSFQQGYRAFNSDQCWVEFSTNGGTSWSGFEVNTEYAVNSPYVQNTISLNVSNYIANQASVLVRFRWTSASANSGYAWMIDDVKLLESLNNDIILVKPNLATDIATTNGLDYRRIPASQVSFPGITFGATVKNNGALDQANVALNVTSGTYNETGASVALTSLSTDSLLISTPFMVPTAPGAYTLNMTTVIDDTDSDLTNNTRSFIVERTAFDYGRDNNTIAGSIAQISSQDGQELSIGNLMDIFDDMLVTNIRVRLTNQPLAVGQEFNAAIYIYDGNDFYLEAETAYHSVVTANLSNFVTLKFNNPVLLPAGSEVLVVAHHLGGENEIAFGTAQAAEPQTVFGFTATNELFSLLSPSVVMVRLNDDPSVGLSENELLNGVNIFPNPSANDATVEFNLANASDVVINVLDITGKTVETIKIGNATAGANSANLNVTNFATGIYNVVISSNEASVTKKFVKK